MPKAAPADPLRVVEPDIGLIYLEQTFRQALDVYEAARQRFNACEDRYFDLRPHIPEALTGDGPLGHLLCEPCSHWRAADLRRMLKNPEHREVWGQVRAALLKADIVSIGGPLKSSWISGKRQILKIAD